MSCVQGLEPAQLQLSAWLCHVVVREQAGAACAGACACACAGECAV